MNYCVVRNARVVERVLRTFAPPPLPFTPPSKPPQPNPGKPVVSCHFFLPSLVWAPLEPEAAGKASFIRSAQPASGLGGQRQASIWKKAQNALNNLKLEERSKDVDLREAKEAALPQQQLPSRLQEDQVGKQKVRYERFFPLLRLRVTVGWAFSINLLFKSNKCTKFQTYGFVIESSDPNFPS